MKAKNPETGPPPRTEWWVNCAIPTTHVVLLLFHTLFAQSFVFFKPDSFWKRKMIHLYQRETASTQHSCGDSTTITCDVIMLPVVTHAPNITNIAPKPLVCTDPRILLNFYTSIASNTVLRLNGSIFHFKFSYITFTNEYFTAWGITIVFPQIPLFKKNVRFFHSFVGSYIGTIYHHKNFTGRVFLWGNFTSPPINLFHTRKILARHRSPNGPHLL